LFEFERFNDELKKKCKIAILSSSDNKRDIERIVDNDYVVKYITKPLTQDALVEISGVL
jgi:CheY-like chemotaxis protein